MPNYSGAWTLTAQAQAKGQNIWQAPPVSIVLSQYGDVSNNNLVAYPFSPDTGYGTRFLASGSSSAGQSAVFSPSNKVVLSANAGFKMVAFPWSDTTGFGVAYSSPSVSPASSIYSVIFSASGNAVFGGGPTTSPYIAAYAWSDTTGFGTKYADPATVPPAGSTDNYTLSITRTNKTIAMCGGAAPYISAYPWSDATGFGVKFADPTYAYAAAANSISFNPVSTALAFVTGTTLGAYPFSETTGFGTQYTTASTASTANTVVFHPSNNFIMISNSSPGNGIRIYPWSDTTGFGSATVVSTNQTNAVAWSPDGNLIVGAKSSSPWVRTWPFNPSTNTVGTVYSDPSSLPTTTTAVQSVAFSN